MQLTVGVVQAADLVAKDMGGSSDPFVKVTLLPDKKRFTTKVHPKTLTPTFNETFVFKTTYPEVLNKLLTFAMYDYDRFTKSDLMGTVTVELRKVDLSRTLEEWRNLVDPKIVEERQLGEVCFSLRYAPTSGKLTVIILEARNVKGMDVGGNSGT